MSLSASLFSRLPHTASNLICLFIAGSQGSLSMLARRLRPPAPLLSPARTLVTAIRARLCGRELATRIRSCEGKIPRKKNHLPLSHTCSLESRLSGSGRLEVCSQLQGLTLAPHWIRNMERSLHCCCLFCCFCYCQCTCCCCTPPRRGCSSGRCPDTLGWRRESQAGTRSFAHFPKITS